MAQSKRKAPYLAQMGHVRVKDAFELLTAHKDEYIVRENGRPVDYREAIRRYKETGDEAWVMHVLASNLGYFANALAKVAAKYGVPPEDYVAFVYEGLRRSMEKCDASRVRLSYLAAGVFFICRRVAEHEVKRKANEVDAYLTFPEGDEDGDDEVLMDLDTWLAQNGIYEVPLSDEDTCEAPDE